MEQWLIQNQVWCRILIFLCVFSMLAVWETFYAWRPWLIARKTRWMRHLSLTCLSKIILRVLFPVFLITVAVRVEQKGMGLLSHFPYAAQVIFGFIAMDLIMYMQHRLFHKYQWLWRIHRVHHMDRQIDVSTGVRFHPLEEIISMGVKMLGVAFVGVPALAVFFFEVILNAMTMFVHVNICLSRRVERLLRKVIITPGMHRIHHSDYSPETNSNYGFCFSWWDKMFDSYTLVSTAGERKFTMGLEDYQDPKYQTLENMLLVPFNIKRLKVRHKKPLKTKFKLFEEITQPKKR